MQGELFLTHLYNRRILLIISGGIAAYKSLDLIRRLKDEGASVRCVLTEGGAQFITPLSVSALSGEPVFTKLFSETDEQRFGHIRLSRETDLIVVAPASANLMAKMAHGLADNLASAVLLATNKPVLLAPAMNSAMWQSPAMQANMATLLSRGVKTIGPASGTLACGEEGAGRMSEVSDILAAIKEHFSVSGPLSGLHALVTSGPTYEPLDPVRFIGNRSSGKQGHAIAAALAAQGADVTLVSGPVALPDPANVKTVPVQTAREMLAACEQNGPFDITVCAAAVADWRPAAQADEKMKKATGSLPPAVALVENPDILASLSKLSPSRPKLVVGFAAETGDLIKLAQEKFARKGCDWLLANDVGGGKIFGADENEVTLLRKNASGVIASEPWPRASKDAIALKLAEEIAKVFEKGKA